MCQNGVEEEGGYVSIYVDMCRYGVEEEERYVSICGIVLDSRQGEELGESYTSSVNPIIYMSILVF
jgi:hypothetical protein